MAIKRLNENPTIADTLVIDIETPDADGCFLVNPYKVDYVKIFFIERNNATGNNYSQYDHPIYNLDTQAELVAATKEACANPTEENLTEVARLKSLLSLTAGKDTFYYSDATTVGVFGNDDFPAWLSTDIENSSIDNITHDEEDERLYGKFELVWEPHNMREGDYFVCWSWSMNPDGDQLSNYSYFFLNADLKLNPSLSSHKSDPEKFEILLERYMPERFKSKITPNDLTPVILSEFNKSVAKGFTLLDDQISRIIDLLDGNIAPAYMLESLSKLFGIKLRSSDVVRWRRQIKRAVPLAKKKGTLSGITEALSQAGINLTKLTKLWQVSSPYSWQDYYLYDEDNEFKLTKTPILPLTDAELYLRDINGDWESVDISNITIDEDDYTVTWTGDELEEGDSIRLLYLYREFPDEDAEVIEAYIRTLPLMDDRDERDQTYPLKNWNTRLIEEDDALFNDVVPLKHIFYEDVVFGKVRTEFPFSENMFNTEEYNGSIRDSTSPCDIDRDFIDECTACQSSKYNVDLEIENLSSDRIIESQEILKEYMPFHAQLNSANISGALEDIVQPPIENIDMLVNYSFDEFTVSSGQALFNRAMDSSNKIKRNELTDITNVVSAGNATAYNENVVLFSPNMKISGKGLTVDEPYTLLEVLSPSVNSGSYTVNSPDGYFVNVTGADEPLDESAFTYRLTNIRAEKSSVDIYQDDKFEFYDANVNFSELNVQSLWDVDKGTADAVWTVEIAAYSDSYDILNILPDGKLILSDPDRTLPTSNTNSITYTIKDGDDETIVSSNTGSLTVSRRGRIDLIDGNLIVEGSAVSLDDVRSFFDSYHNYGEMHYILYDGVQYAVGDLVESETLQFYINDYTDGDASGVSISVYQRLIHNQRGFFHYSGLKLSTDDDQEVDLNIRNGDNAESLYGAVDAHGDNYTLQLDNSTFYQNFLILIDSEYYAISRIDGQDIYLLGPPKSWGTVGESITYDVFWHEKKSLSIQARTYPPYVGHDFDSIDRNGNDIITLHNSADDSIIALATMMNTPEQEVSEHNQQTEGISIIIETDEGSQTINL